MKIYLSKVVDASDFYRAAFHAQMWTENERWHGSRYADVAEVLEFNGYGNDDVHSARRPNERVSTGNYAATWDQWGILLALIFDLDPDAKVGGYKRPYYNGADDFHYQTGARFTDTGVINAGIMAMLTDFHGDHTWRSGNYYYEQHCTKCSAVRRWS